MCLWAFTNQRRSLTQHLEFLKDFGHLRDPISKFINKYMILLCIYICLHGEETSMTSCNCEGEADCEI